MTEPALTRTWDRRLLILLPILAAALVLRLHNLGKPSMWFDERASVMSAAGHFGDWMNLPLDRAINPPDLTGVWQQASWAATWRSPDFHPPLYAAALRIWRNLFGISDTAARSLSVVVSLAAILCLFDLARTLVGVVPALWACAVMAAARPEIVYAQEARGYALWSALALGASAAAARLLKYGPGRRRAGALAICTAAMLLTHFLAVTSVLAVAIFCAMTLRGRPLRQAAIAGGIALAILVIAGSGLPLQAYQTHQDAMWLREAPVGHVINTLQRLALMPANFLAEPTSKAQWISGAMLVAYVLPWLLARRNPAMLWCALWLTCGVGAVFLMDITAGTQALSYPRFTLAAAPALYLLISSMPLQPFLMHLLPAAAIAGCLLTPPIDNDWKGQWRELGNDLHGVVRAGDVVVFASPSDLFLVDPRKLFEGTAFYCRPIPCPVILLDKHADAAVLNDLHAARHVWVVSTISKDDLGKYLPGFQANPAALSRLYCGQLWSAAPVAAEANK